jgi:hypothetical protein
LLFDNPAARCEVANFAAVAAPDAETGLEDLPGLDRPRE